jgi:hypothetical protein
VIFTRRPGVVLAQQVTSPKHGEIQRALAEGTETRLFFHAAVIASQAGHVADAERWLRKARELSQLLLPSERNELQNAAACGAEKKASIAPNPQPPFSLEPNTARKTQPQPQTKT